MELIRRPILDVSILNRYLTIPLSINLSIYLLYRQEIELTGRPEAPTINSTPEGLFANSFELAFTVKSFSLVRNVEILYRKKVLID